MEAERIKFLRRINQNSGRKIRDLSECWLWNYNPHSSGYAQYQSNWAKQNKVIYAHQSAYRLFKDPTYEASRERPCSHLCESPDDYRHRLCCNPDHLYIANSVQENIADRQDNRGNYQQRTLGGTKSKNSIFNKEDIEEIKRLRATGMIYKDIAEIYDCSRRTIEKVCLEKTYKS